MSNWFTNPALLWSALLFLPMLALYMLRHRPVRRRVPSVLLWKGVAQMQVATSPFQKLRKSTSLILMLIALLFMVLALAGFKLPAASTTGTKAIVVIDITASMGAKTEGSTRLQRAIELIPELQNANIELAKVLTWDGQMHDVTTETLSELKAVDFGASANSLRQNLKSIVRENPDKQIILISDTEIDGIEGLTTFGVGKESLNVAITAASIQEVTPTQLNLFIGLELFHAKQHKTTLVIERQTADGFELIDSAVFNLQSGIRTPYELKNVKPGLYRASLKEADSFVLDNVAWLRVSRLEKIDVVVHGNPGKAVLRATKAIEDSMGLVQIVEREKPSRSNLTTHLFAEESTAGSLALLPSAYFAPAALPPEVKTEPALDVSTESSQRIDNALWRGVGSTDVQISKVHPLKTSRWFEPLLTSGDTPALVLLQRKDSSLKDLLFLTPLESEETGFTETVAFLVFWANWYDHVRRSTDPLPRGAIRTRESFTPWAPGQNSEITITNIASDKSDTLTFGQLYSAENIGLFKCEGLKGPLPHAFGASLLDVSESALPVASTKGLESKLATLAALESDTTEDVELAKWLLLLACGIFLAEWLLYRRKFKTQPEEPTKAQAQPMRYIPWV